MRLFPTLLVLLSASCSQQFTISVNEQPVYDPTGHLPGDEVSNADLQGCINFVMQQQNLDSEAELTVLTCADSQVTDLDNIDRLVQLRFLNLAGNNITNLTPLEGLPVLGGLNLINNAITDIGPLFNIPSLVSVNLLGNDGIACAQLTRLQARLGDNLTPPQRCRR